MADQDPFEAALSAMSEADGGGEDVEHSESDPFASDANEAQAADGSDDPFSAALKAMEDAGGSDTSSEPEGGSGGDPMDPFESAMNAMQESEGDSAGGGSTDPFESAMNAMQESGGDSTRDSAPKSAADPFEAALQTMDGGEAQAKSDDPFAAALEVAKTEHKVAEATKKTAADGQELDIDFLMDIKVNITFEVGRAKMYISDLLSLGQGSVIELHRLVGEELELFVNGQLLATGEVVVVNEKFGARISQILSPEERIARLGAVTT